MEITPFLSNHKKQIAKYLVVGGTSVFLDVGILYVLKQVFAVPATIGVVFGQGIVVLYNFLLNKYWSFEAAKSIHTQFGKYFLLLGVNYGTGIGLMYLFHDVFGFHYIAVRLVTVAFFVPINFFLYKYWVYKKN